MKEQIIKDLKFRERCNEFGLNPDELEIQYIDNDYILVLKSFGDDIYFIFDKYYNIIAIDTFHWKEKEYSYKRFLQENYESYSKRTIEDIIHIPEWFPYPFIKYTFQNIMNISNKIEIRIANHGHSLMTFVNNTEVEKNIDNKVYLELITYLKFIKLRIDDYYRLKYHFLRMKINMVNVYEYLKKIILKISDYLDYCINNNLNPNPRDIIDFIGYNYDEETIMLLYDVINIMLREKGFTINNGTIEKINVQNFY